MEKLRGSTLHGCLQLAGRFGNSLTVNAQRSGAVETSRCGSFQRTENFCQGKTNFTTSWFLKKKPPQGFCEPSTMLANVVRNSDRYFVGTPWCPS